MCIDGDVLELDMEMDLEEVKALQLFVKDRLAYIEEIVVLASKDVVPSTSSLFALLHVMKRQKPSLKIDFIDKGSVSIGAYGTLYWNAHE